MHTFRFQINALARLVSDFFCFLLTLFIWWFAFLFLFIESRQLSFVNSVRIFISIVQHNSIFVLLVCKCLVRCVPFSIRSECVYEIENSEIARERERERASEIIPSINTPIWKLWLLKVFIIVCKICVHCKRSN